MPNQSPQVGAKTSLYPYGYGFCQCGCGQRTKLSLSGVYPMYLSKKDRAADRTGHALVQRYEQEHRNSLSKMRNITHEVELVARMVKVLWNTNADDKQLALEKLVGILDTLNSLRYQQREVLKKPEDTKQRGNNRRNGGNLRRAVDSAHVSLDALSASRADAETRDTDQTIIGVNAKCKRVGSILAEK